MKVDYQDFTYRDMPKEQRRKLNVGDIWSNTAQCLICGDILRSTNLHDYVTCTCKNLSVDGGSWYLKRAATNPKLIEELSELYNDL